MSTKTASAHLLAYKHGQLIFEAALEVHRALKGEAVLIVHVAREAA